jgi:putative oxidoreductase
LILGILPQLAALGLMLLMLGTMRLHIFRWKSPYWASKGGWEYDLMLFTLSAVILVHGAGRFVIYNL